MYKRQLYIDGKQKISSSGTQNLEDAIPILEKWFDDVHANKEKEASKTEETQDLSGQTSATSSSATSAPVAEATPAPITPPVAETPKPVVSSVENENNQKPQINVSDNKESTESKKSISSLLDKLKNIKLKKPSFASGLKMPKASSGGANNFKNNCLLYTSPSPRD